MIFFIELILDSCTSAVAWEGNPKLWASNEGIASSGMLCALIEGDCNDGGAHI